MGFGSGTYVMKDFINGIQDQGFDFDERFKMYTVLANVLKDLDWDCPQDCLGIDQAYDELYKQRYPAHWAEMQEHIAEEE